MKYKVIIFDLDGTIYFGNQLADKANEVIRNARNNSQKIFFVTNNSAKMRREIYDKLINLGIELEQKELITSSYAIAKYLKDTQYKDVYCVGTNSLKSEIELMGINVYSRNPQAVVVGYNINFKLSDLDELANIHLADYKLVVGNKERIYPKENGYLLPGAGPIVASVEALLNKQSDIIIGKPNVEMLNIVLSGLNVQPDEVCIIGDSYDSDIKMAQNYGAKGILITKENRNDCECIKNLSDLLELWK